jgi:hypothetical protein
MPRKKHAVAEAEASANVEKAEPIAAPAPAPIAEPGAEPDAEAHGKNWGPPYKAIFTSSAKGFEMGENRRFKQRVFKFIEKPDSEVIAILKDNGFTYRPEEKAWTIHADNASRLLSDQLAARFAGQSPDLSR